MSRLGLTQRSAGLAVQLALDNSVELRILPARSVTKDRDPLGTYLSQSSSRLWFPYISFEARCGFIPLQETSQRIDCSV